MLHLLLYNLGVALRDMLRKPFRTFLVLQGMIWGAAAAVMPPAIIDGSRRAMIERASKVGTDRVALMADRTEKAGALTLDDVEFLKKKYPGKILAAAPFRARAAVFRRKGELTAGWIVGTTPEELEARGLELSAGAFFGPGRPGGVIEEELAKSLAFDPPSSSSGPVEVFFTAPPDAPDAAVPVIEKEREPDLRVEDIVGALAPLPPERTEADDFGMKRNHFLAGIAKDMMSNLGVESNIEPWRRGERTLHVPIEWMEEKAGRVDLIILKIEPEAVVDLVDAVQKDLSERNRQPLVRWNLMAPVLLKGGLDRYVRLRYATFLLCLTMGAIVISNVMLFFVLESYREIAIRRVEGATRADIALQYLCYSTLLSVTGGLLGMPVGMFIAQIRIWLSPAVGLALSFPWGSAGLVLACTVASGILAGVLPALRAARLDPVEALRHE
ncbi:MAG: ABC transporter permease [Planctomycetota bacterium]|jgi:hypothetical protein